jgi:peptidoglycan/xylan/chitin deacetylase (PgdA/CDA1 family)
VLELLASADVRATFFVEGLNAELYPDALRSIADAGHEVAFHGWQHERWADLSPQEEHESFERGVTALDGLGLRPVGFRPPGGELTPATPGLLREFGFEYCSPLGRSVERRDGLVLLPFRWELVDALYYLPHFASLRGTDEILPPSRLRETIDAALEGFAVLIFHPFLLEDEKRFEVLRWAVERVRSTPGREVARAQTAAG